MCLFVHSSRKPKKCPEGKEWGPLDETGKRYGWVTVANTHTEDSAASVASVTSSATESTLGKSTYDAMFSPRDSVWSQGTTDTPSWDHSTYGQSNPSQSSEHHKYQSTLGGGFLDDSEDATSEEGTVASTAETGSTWETASGSVSNSRVDPSAARPGGNAYVDLVTRKLDSSAATPSHRNEASPVLNSMNDQSQSAATVRYETKPSAGSASTAFSTTSTNSESGSRQLPTDPSVGAFWADALSTSEDESVDKSWTSSI